MRQAAMVLAVLAAAGAAIALGAAPAQAAGGPAGEAEVLIEAESLASRGGWVVDQQFMDQMGSPYLLAHGLGKPVANAAAEVDLPKPGGYWVWLRAKDWVPSHHLDTIRDAEAIRDYLLCAIYGSFATAKKAEPEKYARRELLWVPYVGGKRESRRLMGDYVSPTSPSAPRA